MEDGIWRTIRGRRIFIKSGESLGSAMQRSGKFKNLTRTKLRETRDEMSKEDRLHRSAKNIDKFNASNKKNIREALHRKIDKDFNKISRVQDKPNVEQQAFDNRTNETENYYTNAKTRVERNRLRYSKADQRELRHEELQKKLADYKANKKGNEGLTLAEEERIRKNELQTRNQEALNRRTLQSQNDKEKAIADFKAKKQSNNKVETWEEKVKRLEKENAKNKNYEIPKQSNLEKVSDNKYKVNADIDFKMMGESEKDYQDRMERKDLKYRNRVEKNFDNYGREDRKEAQREELARAEKDMLESKYPRAKGATKWEDLGLKVEDRKGFSDYLQDKYGTDDFRIINFDRKDEAKQIYDEFKNKQYYKGTQRWGFGYANDDNIPVYNNNIDYTGDFTHANLSKVSDDDLTKALNKQTELYNEAISRKVGDRRTRNGKNDEIFKKTDTLRYGNGINKIREEMQNRQNNNANTIKSFKEKKQSNHLVGNSNRLTRKQMAEALVDDQIKRGIIKDTNRDKQVQSRLTGKFKMSETKLRDYYNKYLNK